MGCDDSGQHIVDYNCSLTTASIKINGHERSLNGRGINVVVVNRINGHVLHQRFFDTAASPAEANKMASLLRMIPLNSIILGAVKDDAKRYSNETQLLTEMACVFVYWSFF